jgi:hypothetical protein
VPIRLGASPNTATRKVSTMYNRPAVGLVQPIMLNALPATPAMPQPNPKVKRSSRSVSIPTALTIGRFEITARARLPQKISRYAHGY